MTQEEKTSRTRERILTAAIEEFGTKGYTGATVGEICGEHNITKGLLYHNFASKEELYLACVSRCFDQVTNYLQGQESNGTWNGVFNSFPRTHFTPGSFLKLSCSRQKN